MSLHCANKQCVAVVGAGVIGLTTALHLTERFPTSLDVTIFAEKFSPHVTTNKSGAVINPIASNDAMSSSERTKYRKWTRNSFEKFHSLYNSKENDIICLRNGYYFGYSESTSSWGSDLVFGFRSVDLESDEARAIHTPSDCLFVWSYSTYILDPTRYMEWLMDKFKANGGHVEKRKIAHLDELESSSDIILNCSGLGSRELLNDKLLYPLKGQALLVRAPWIQHFIANYRLDGIMTYIYPRANGVVLGGTQQRDDWSETPDPNTRDAILKRCMEFAPSLSKAEVIDEWVGLRPKRETIRLESCECPNGSLLVHCYGHGGKGVLLSWGCAMEIGDIVTAKTQSRNG